MIGASSKKRVTAPTRSSPSRDAPSPTRRVRFSAGLVSARHEVEPRVVEPYRDDLWPTLTTHPARERASAYISSPQLVQKRWPRPKRERRLSKRQRATDALALARAQLGAPVAPDVQRAKALFFASRIFKSGGETRFAHFAIRRVELPKPKPGGAQASRASSSSSSSSSSFGVSGAPLLESRESRESRRRSRREDSRAPGTSPGGASRVAARRVRLLGQEHRPRARRRGGATTSDFSRRFWSVFSREKSADSAAATSYV